MTTVLWAGTIVGAVLGCLHGIYVYRVVAAQAGTIGHVRAGYYALCTLALWTLLGSYVLILWLISVIAYAIARTVGWRT